MTGVTGKEWYSGNDGQREYGLRCAERAGTRRNWNWQWAKGPAEQRGDFVSPAADEVPREPPRPQTVHARPGENHPGLVERPNAG